MGILLKPLPTLAPKHLQATNFRKEPFSNQAFIGLTDFISTPLKAFNKRRPKFVEPGSYLNPSLQNMFALGYFSGSKEMIPSGWNVVDDDKTYPSLESRAPPLAQSFGDSPDGFESSNGRSRSESSVEDDTFQSGPYSTQTRMNDESSSEDELAGAPPKVGHNFIIIIAYSQCEPSFMGLPCLVSILTED
jgi:hypothetical protein